MRGAPNEEEMRIACAKSAVRGSCRGFLTSVVYPLVSVSSLAVSTTWTSGCASMAGGPHP